MSAQERKVLDLLRHEIVDRPKSQILGGGRDECVAVSALYSADGWPVPYAVYQAVFMIAIDNIT